VQFRIGLVPAGGTEQRRVQRSLSLTVIFDDKVSRMVGVVRLL
jgi:hypothetical protein